MSHTIALNLPYDFNLFSKAIFIVVLTSFPFCFIPTCSRIIEGKEKDDPKTIPLKIFAKDIGNCAYVRLSSFLCQHKTNIISACRSVG